MFDSFSTTLLTETYWKMRRPPALKRLKTLPVGLDGLSCEKFEARISMHLSEIERKIKTHSYNFAPLLELERSKSNGGVRRLYIPRLRDQIVLRVLHDAIIANAENNGIVLHQKTPYEVVRKFDVATQEIKTPWIVRTDITSFYDSIPRTALLTLFDTLNPDPTISNLLHTWSEQLKSRKGFTIGKEAETPLLGLPQGLSISAPLSELWAKQIDIEYATKSNYFRYVDDITLVCASKDEAEAEFEKLKQIIERLQLQLSPTKTHISALSEGVEWLGITHYGERKELDNEKVKNWLKPFLKLKREAITALSTTTDSEATKEVVVQYIKKIEVQINGKYANRIRWYALGEDYGQWKYADKLIHEMIRSVCRNAGMDVGTLKQLPSVHASIYKYKKLKGVT
jgi:retron-type reverse transcriptase